MNRACVRPGDMRNSTTKTERLKCFTKKALTQLPTGSKNETLVMSKRVCFLENTKKPQHVARMVTCKQREKRENGCPGDFSK